VHVEDVLSTIELLARDLPRCATLLTVAPQFKRQQDSYDKVLRIITHLMHLVTKLPATQDVQVRRRVRKAFSARFHPSPFSGLKMRGARVANFHFLSPFCHATLSVRVLAGPGRRAGYTSCVRESAIPRARQQLFFA